jgi:hypothetical protein
MGIHHPGQESLTIEPLGRLAEMGGDSPERPVVAKLDLVSRLERPVYPDEIGLEDLHVLRS